MKWLGLRVGLLFILFGLQSQAFCHGQGWLKLTTQDGSENISYHRQKISLWMNTPWTPWLMTEAITFKIQLQSSLGSHEINYKESFNLNEEAFFEPTIFSPVFFTESGQLLALKIQKLKFKKIKLQVVFYNNHQEVVSSLFPTFLDCE